MSQEKSSIVWMFSNEEFFDIINNSNTKGEVLKKMGLNPYSGGGYRTLNQRIKRDKIDTTSLMERAKKEKNEKLISTVKAKYEDIFQRNSKYNGGNKQIKKMLLSMRIIDNKCSECGTNDKWNEKPLSLQLDHINGINNDNRVENLRLLCPNCHSQTITYGGKSKKFLKTVSTVDRAILEKVLKEKTIKETAKIFHVCYSTMLKIMKHYKIDYDTKIKSKIKVINNRKFNVSKEDLETLVKEKPMTEIGRMFGVSDNAIKKRCKSLGIVIGYRRGFWTKKLYNKTI